MHSSASVNEFGFRVPIVADGEGAKQAGLSIDAAEGAKA